MKESQVLLQKDSGGKAKELLPLMQGPIPALYRDKGIEERAAQSPARLLGSAVWAHQAGVAEGLIYLTYRGVGSHLYSLDLKTKFTKVNYLTSRRRGVQGQDTEVNSEP